MEKVQWTIYKEKKPEDVGTYLVVFETANKNQEIRVGDVAYFHPNHGWTGCANTLEKVITHWAPFPWPRSE